MAPGRAQLTGVLGTYKGRKQGRRAPRQRSIQRKNCTAVTIDCLPTVM